VYHDPEFHNILTDGNAPEQFVTENDALAYNYYKQLSKDALDKKVPWYKASID